MPKKKRTLTARRKLLRNFLFGFGAVVAIGLIILLWFGLRRPEVIIANVDVSGTHYIDGSAVKSFTEEALDGSYFWFVPRKNALFYPKKDIEKTLVENFLPINILSIDRDRFTGLLISIEERQPIGAWCDTLSTSTPCYLVDKTGLLFETTDSSPSGTMMYHSVPEKTLGDVFLDGDFLKLHEMVTTIQTITGHSAHSVLVDEHDDVYVFFREGGELRFVRTDDKETLLDNITSTFSSRRFEEGEAFEYVDFRFGNKVYVKFLD